MKQLPAWVTASKRKYQGNIFIRTWWNIVIFHTFFVLVMVIVFGYILYYTKLNLFTTVNGMLKVILQGGAVDPTLISHTSQELDHLNFIVLCGMVVFAGITGVIAAQITLRPTKDEFIQRKKFITAVAHELRTPLAVLRTSNEVALYDAEDQPKLKKILQENIEETKHIANLVNNLVIFSRVGAAESFSYERTEIPELLESAIRKLTAYAQKKHITIEYERVPLPHVHANKTALEQIFYNLIKNAIVYSKPEGGIVRIAAAASKTHLTITFSDTGIGMSNKTLQHIFEPFYRANPDSSQAASGTGLGLALVFEIMKLHRGTIDVESTEGVGTTFTLQLPLPNAALVQERPKHIGSLFFSFEK